MSFLNIQVGGSCFAHNENRSKNFTGAPDANPELLDSVNAKSAHVRMYDNAINMLMDFRAETMELDNERIAAEQAEARQLLDRDRGDRPQPAVTEPNNVEKTEAESAGKEVQTNG